VYLAARLIRPLLFPVSQLLISAPSGERFLWLAPGEGLNSSCSAVHMNSGRRASSPGSSEAPGQFWSGPPQDEKRHRLVNRNRVGPRPLQRALFTFWLLEGVRGLSFWNADTDSPHLLVIPAHTVHILPSDVGDLNSALSPGIYRPDQPIREITPKFCFCKLDSLRLHLSPRRRC
jgi:hypothetical protein